MNSKNILTLFLFSTTIAACAGAPPQPAHTPTSAMTAQLPARDAPLADRRAAAIARLHDYGLAGEFPADATGTPLAVFRDDRGRRCPMSELIFASGHAELVDAVVRDNNQLRLVDVHDGPVLAWILDSGLTHEETIAIQGLMEIGSWAAPGQDLAQQQAAQRAEIQRKIAERERQLRADTATSLRVAASRARHAGANATARR